MISKHGTPGGAPARNAAAGSFQRMASERRPGSVRGESGDRPGASGRPRLISALGPGSAREPPGAPMQVAWLGSFDGVDVHEQVTDADFDQVCGIGVAEEDGRPMGRSCRRFLLLPSLC